MGQVIVFDTSVLYGLNRGSPKFDVLRALKHSGAHQAGIPWMVQEELVAQQVLEYRTAHERASNAAAALRRKTPWAIRAFVPARDEERVKDHWRNQYQEVLTVLDTSGEAAKLALAREAYCEKPAKVDSKAKSGARDVAIWLSVIDYLKANPEQTVFFVSDNTHDFGDGTAYLSPMAEDLGDTQSRLKQLTSFEEFVSQFTQTIDADTEHVKELLISVIGDSPTQIEMTPN